MEKRRKKAGRKVPISDRTSEILKRKREEFREKFGREPGPGDPVFFDPDASEPLPLDGEKIKSDLVAAMEAAGIDPALIFAYRKTGMLVSEANLEQWSEEDLAEYRAALEDYERLRERRN